MKMILRFLPLALLLTCASVQSASLDNEGKKVHQLTCSEFNSSKQECQVKAVELCANEFNKYTHYQEVYADPGDGMYMPTRHHFTVECKT